MAPMKDEPVATIAAAPLSKTTLLPAQSQEPQVIHLPDLLAHWPWQAKLSPHFEKVEKEHQAWFKSLDIMSSPEAQKVFERCKHSFLVSMAVPNLDEAGLRLCCDNTCMAFLFDDWTDNVSADEARAMGDVFLDAMWNPNKPRPAGEWPIGRMAADFMRRFTPLVTPVTLRRFIKWTEDYIDATVKQSTIRNQPGYGIAEYIAHRRIDVGMLPSMAVGQLYTELPDEIIDSSVIAELNEIFCELILAENDVWSYTKELARGDTHNLVSVVMRTHGVDAQAAMDWVGDYHEKLIDRFLAAHARLPVLQDGKMDRELREYVQVMVNWVCANEAWSFESGRYFGNDGARVKRERTVTLPMGV